MTATLIEPGVYDGIPDNDYHAMLTHLSCSSARRLLDPSCPALFKHERENGREPKDEYDLGHAVHKEVLGVGSEVRYIQGHDAKGNPSEGWATKNAKEQKAQAHADGAIPLLAKEKPAVEAMAAAVRNHPLAGKLLDPPTGKAEQSMFWVDEESGVPLKCRADFLRTSGSRLIIVDFKTGQNANPWKFVKTAADYGYHQQDSWYRMAATALDLDPDPAFMFVIVETKAPYLVSVVELDSPSKRIGAGLNRAAINTYKQCSETGEFPGFTDDQPAVVSLPTWIQNQFEEYL